MPRRPITVADLAARDLVGTGTVMSYAASAATPLTVGAAIVTTGLAVTGQIGLAAAFVAIGATLMLFSIGYTAMAGEIPNSGAFYAFLARGIGRPIGVGGAWVALVAYSGLEIGLFGAISPAAAPVLHWFGIDPPWWAIAAGAWALVTALGLRRMRRSHQIMRVLLLAEVSLLLLYSLANLVHPAGGHVSWQALSPTTLLVDGAGPILALAVLGFIGFEQPAVFVERARSPRVVRRAVFLSVLGLGILYTLSAFSTVAAVGPDAVVETARTQQAELLFTLAEQNLGGWAVVLGRLLLVTSVLAALIAFHHTTSSYAYALGREGVLPRKLGLENPRTQQPQNASLVQSGLGLVVITLFAVLGLDPLVDLFYLFGTSGALGVLLLLAGTSIAVVVFFTRHPHRQSAWSGRIAPVISSLLLIVILGLAVVNIDILLGVPATAPQRWVVPALFALVLLGGIAYGLHLRTAGRQVYNAIGLGAEAATTAELAR